LASGTFLPSDGIYIGIDNFNAGVGFGSFGVPPSSSSFPGQPAYPFGMSGRDGFVLSYNLRGNETEHGPGFSCVDFPNTCLAPIPLATTAGDLILYGGFQSGDETTFTARVGPSVPEPEAFGVLCLGFAGVAVARWRRLSTH
jgi:hypothetical protein